MDLTTYAELAVRLANTASYQEDGHDRLTTMDELRLLVADREHLSTGATRADLETLPRRRRAGVPKWPGSSIPC